MEFEFSDKKSISLERVSDQLWSIDGMDIKASLLPVSGYEYHILKEGVSYRVSVESSDLSTGSLTLSINGTRIRLRAKGRYEDLLQSLGMNAMAGSKAKDLKAPMPGLVIDIPVSAGQEVSEGDSLIILEAMKMENVIKADATAVIKEIKVNSSDSVEKNQVLITFER